MKKKRLLVLASGRGTNFRALAEGALSGALSHFEIMGLVSNRADSGALKIAQSLKVPTYLIDSALYFGDKSKGRDFYNKLLHELLVSLIPDLIALAGYMLILDPKTVETFHNRILNIHPSLLPKYPGLHPQRRALEEGDQETGCTIHWVTQELDAGPILLQKKLSILPDDTEESLTNRLLKVEHLAYLEALNLLGARDSFNSN